MAATMKTDDSALGAAITRGLASRQPAGECPSIETIAEQVDGTLAGVERDRLLGHLALCDSCRELFLKSSRLASEEPAVSQQADGKRRNYLFPSALAAAALLVIAVTLQMRPFSSDKGMVAESAAPAAPRVALSEQGRVNPPDESGQVSVAAKSAAPVAAGKKAVVASEGSAHGSDRLARLLVRHGKPEQLAALASARDKNFGFAVKGDANSLAFRIGVNLINLELALLADDGDRAQAQAARLSPLLEMLAGNPDAPPLERMVASLEQGVAPSSVAGRSGELERLVPREQLPYARLGAWAQGAMLAARSGDREYLAAGVPRYFGDRAADSALPHQAAAALRDLGQKLKKPRSIDLELVERDLAVLLGAF